MKKFALIVVALIAAAYAWLNIYPKYELHYRLTVETEVDGKPLSASGVIGILYARPRCLLCNNRFAAAVKGEAIPVDLGDRGTFFVLLIEGKDQTSNPEFIVLDTFRDNGRYPEGEDFVSAASKLSGKVNLPLSRLPMIVRFADINDPKSVEQVDPEHMDKTFGPGVKIVHASLEITKDPISTGIEKRFPPWFGELRSKRAKLDGQVNMGTGIGAALAHKIGTGGFQSGVNEPVGTTDPWAKK